MDIFKLTKSKTREKILQFFFSDINKKYYLRELERILNLSVGNIRRELLSLAKSGLFSREEIGKQVYYSINKESPIFEEFKKIISKTIGVEALISNALKNIKNIKIAFVFGSFARNKEDSLSDIDLMLIGNPNEDVLISKISLAEDQLKREINYSIFSLQDFKNGLRKKDVFLEEILANPKLFIIGDQNELEKVIRRRQSPKKKISFKETESVLAKAYESLRAAEVLIKQDFCDPAFKEAYESMLLSGRALIFSLGYKPRTIGAHSITAKFCQLYFGIDLRILTDKFDKMRKKRNDLIYGAGLTISKTEAENAIKTARDFMGKIKIFIQKRNPQKRLI